MLRWPRWTRSDYAVILVCAIGTGIAALAFAALDAVLLRPLPYHAPDRIVRLVGINEQGIANGPLPLPLVQAMAQRVGAIATHAVADEWDPTLSDAGGSEYLVGASVSAGFFDVFGVPAYRGRLFAAQDDAAGHEPVVVLSHGLWQQRFGAADGAIGGLIALNGVSYRVVGVLPPDWEDPGLVDGARAPQLWRASPPYFAQASRSGFSFSAVARLRDGSDPAAVSQALSAVMRTEAQAFPADLAGRGDAAAVPLLQTITGGAGLALRLGFAAALAVWLIALANATNLLLLRALEQRRRMALCRALGASDARLVRGLLGQQVALALAGGALGLALAGVAITALRASGALALVPRLEVLQLGGVTLGVLAAMALLLGLASGLVAARSALRAPIAALSAQARGGAGARDGGRRRIVVTQIALATALVAISLALGASCSRLARTDLGITADSTVAATLRPAAETWGDDARLRTFFDDVLAEARALPGVSTAGASSIAPLADDFSCDSVERMAGSDLPALPAGECAETRVVSADYFGAVGQLLIQGRDFDAASDAPTQPGSVIISRSAARRWWPERDAIGQRLRVHERDLVVVGVVGDVRHFGPAAASPPTVYLPLWQEPAGTMTVFLRGTTAAGISDAALRALVRRHSAGGSVLRIETLQSLAASHALRPRAAALVIASFTAAGAALALLGLFGVIDYLALRRRGEFALRAAVGASAARLRQLVLGDALRLALAGAFAGVVLAALSLPLLRPLMPETDAGSVWTWLVALLAMSGAALLCALAPAQRAAHTPASEVLREA